MAEVAKFKIPSPVEVVRNAVLLKAFEPKAEVIKDEEAYALSHGLDDAIKRVVEA